MNFVKVIGSKLFAPITQVPKPLRANYYPTLDGLRAVAVLIVLLVHVGINKYLRVINCRVDATTGVHMFFVISGFLITTILLKEKVDQGQISLRKFYIRRALRILPVAYLFLLVLIVLNSVYHLKIPAAQFLASFLFYKNLPLPNEPHTAHFWTLAVEEQFYFTFPLLFVYNTKRYLQLAFSIVTFVPLVAIFGQAGILQSSTVWLLMVKVCQYLFWKGPVVILIGSVFAIWVFNGTIKPERFKVNGLLSLALLATAIAISSKDFIFHSKYISAYLSAMLTTVAFFITLVQRDVLAAILSSKLMRTIGTLSYSIYIWQELFIGFGVWQPWLMTFSAYPVWTLILIKLILISIIAVISYQFESIFLRIKKKYSNNTPAPR